MSRITIRGAAAVSLFFTAACTQYPAAIELKGVENFGRSASQVAMYSPPPVILPAEQYAPAPAVAVSDLTAPLPSANKEREEASSAGIQKINPWTGKPRTEFLSESKPKPVKLSTDQSAASFIWPVNGSKVVSAFGPKGAGKANDGINIAAGEGEPVWAAADGEVVYVGNELAGYGNMIIVKHAGNKTTTYAHLSGGAVDKYDRVKQGDIIGYVGSTGNVKSPQLHFAVRDGKEAVDPMKVMSRSVAGL